MQPSTEIWAPSEQQVRDAPITHFATMVATKYGLELEPYDKLHKWSVQHPEQFWGEFAKFADMRFSKTWDAVLQRGSTFQETNWFVGSKLNFAQNLLKHAETPHKDNPAVIFHSEHGERVELTFAELQHKVIALAQQMQRMGVECGDRVAGYLPNQPETVVAMLATTSIGAIWTACSPDFGVEAASDRILQATPKLLFATPCYRYNGKTIDVRAKVEAIAKQATTVENLVWVPYPSLECDTSDGIRWDDLQQQGIQGEFEFVQTDFNHPVYIMYSSGTTGKPKCIVHGAGGTLIQHLKEHILHVGLGQDDRMFYFTTCGWMMWQWLVSALAVGTAIILYDGSPLFPGPECLWEMFAKERGTVFGTSARYLAELQSSNYQPKAKNDLSSTKAILSTGSPLLSDQFRYVYNSIKSDVCLASISGGTDIVSCFVLGNPTLPVKEGQIQCLGLGMDVAFVDEQGNSVVGERGELACRQPFPSMPVKFWNDPTGQIYHKAYFNRIKDTWMHGDYGTLLDDGGVVIHGRSDATLNPGGVRIGTAEIYGQVDKIAEVIDSIVVEKDVGGDKRVALFVVLQQGQKLTGDLRRTIKQQLRQGASPRHVPAYVEQVTAVPRTLNGKLAELAVRNVVNGHPVEGMEALANPECLDQFKNRIRS